jgi:gamma-glutamyltranspeptidase / glutathione hydrolase
MVSSTDRVASEIGAEMLRRGGNAFDAAVAVHFALAVVNPEAGNIGGGGFMVACCRTARRWRWTSGSGAAGGHPDMFLDEEGNVTRASVVGHLASGVPGSVAGMWEATSGTGAALGGVVEPAINLADGIVVHDRLASLAPDQCRPTPAVPGHGRRLPAWWVATPGGDRFSQPDLRETLRRIARDGRDGFYRAVRRT